MLFGSKKIKNRIAKIESQVKYSFTQVKSDIDTQKAWQNYYYNRSIQFENQLKDLYSKIPKGQSSEIKKQINNQQKILASLIENQTKLSKSIVNLRQNSLDPKLTFYIENISGELKTLSKNFEYLSTLEHKIDHLQHELQTHIKSPHTHMNFEERLHQLQNRLDSIISKKTPKDKLVQKVTKNRHDYLIVVVLNLIKKYEKITGFELREMVVEEQNLTSKSTFYRILEEIESSDEVTVVKKGKDKIYFRKLKKHT